MRLVIMMPSEVLRKGKAGTRGIPDGSGPEGEGAGTGRRMPPRKPKREDFEDDATFELALERYNEKAE